MKAVEACGYKEGGAINPVRDCKWGFVVFKGLKEGEVEPQ